MAPRPSSPTISYLPAFVTVGIVQSICRRRSDPRSLTGGHTSADTRAPYPAQYPAKFLPVNATGVPVFRTRYVGMGAPGSQLRHLPKGAGKENAIRGYGLRTETPGAMVRSGAGTLVSRMGRSTSP